MSTLARAILALGATLLACPTLVVAQEPLGVVTTLTGQATRTASAKPEIPAPLRFKDGVFGADTIRTAERSFVRMLLERKAVLTVRELSVLRISDDATQAVVDLRSGGIAFSVARPRLRPEESVLIHTPNAVAAVRGTSIVVETRGAISQFHVLTGTLDVASRANPTGWRRLQAPASLTVTGDAVGVPQTLDSGTRNRLTALYFGLHVSEPTAPAEVVAQEQAKAVLLARLILGEGSGGDQLDLPTTAGASTAQPTPGMQSPTQVPLSPQIPPVAPAVPTSPLHVWNNETATVTGDLLNVSATTNLSRSLARATNSTVTVTNEVVDVTGTLTAGAPAPFVALQSSTLTSRTLAAVAGGTLTLNGGGLLQATGSAVSTTDDLLRVTGGGDLLRPGAAPLLSLSGTTLDVGNGAGDRLLDLTGAGSRVSLGGSLLRADSSALRLTGTSLVEVTTGAALDVAGASPLVGLTGGLLTLSSATGFLFRSTGLSTIGGGLLETTGATVTTTGNLLTVSGQLTATGTLFDITGGTVSARSGVALSSAAGRLTLGGPALSLDGSTLTTTDDLFSITAGARLTDTTTAALLDFTNATVAIGNAGGDQLFVVNGAGSQAALAGPLLTASGGGLAFRGTALVEVSSGATLTDIAAAPLLSLSGGTLTLNGAANAFLLNSAATATLAGGLLETTGTDITAGGDFVRALGNARIVMGGSTAPLLSLTGGTHQFAAAGNIYRLSGTATALDPVSGLTLGTEEPIQGGGPLYEAVGATAAVQRAVRLDVALLQASAPLLNLRANGGVASQLTTTTNTIDLTSRARLNATAPVIALDGSRLTVSGSLVNVAGGSYLAVSGNLLSVANGSQITVNNGALLYARGGSVVNISGALLSFGGAGNTVAVSNAFCPCTIIGGIPVRLSGGALAANVSITNPVKNAAGNTLTIAPNAAAIRVDGLGTRVTISGQ